MQNNRRKYDNMTDHDLLIAHTVKIDTLCKLMRTNNKQLETFSDKLDKRCVHIHDGITETHREIFKKMDDKTDNTTFRWLIGIIVIVILTMSGVVGSDLIGMHANKKAIVQIECDIDDFFKEAPWGRIDLEKHLPGLSTR